VMVVATEAVKVEVKEAAILEAEKKVEVAKRVAAANAAAVAAAVLT